MTRMRHGLSVLVTKPILDDGLALLKAAGHSVTVVDNSVPGFDLVKAARGSSAIISMLTDSLNVSVLKQLAEDGKLEIIAQHAVGIDNIDLEAAKALGIKVTHTPGVLSEATANHAMALLLAAARNIVPGDAYCRSGKWKNFDPTLLLGIDLSGKRMGVIGMGRIGQEVAKRSKAFGMEICYCNRKRVSEIIESECGSARFLSLEELLTTSDIVSLNCPLTPETKHLIDAKRISTMKKNAILVNTARGPIVDEEALAEAMANGHLRAAALDVFEREPEIHPKLLNLPNVLLAPHLGSATEETRARMSRMCGKSVVTCLNGEEPPHQFV